jgi:hypothetical protein
VAFHKKVFTSFQVFKNRRGVDIQYHVIVVDVKAIRESVAGNMYINISVQIKGIKVPFE